MLQTMIKKNEYKQVLILSLLCSQNHVSKLTINNKLQLNTITFARYIRNINHDLNDLFPQKNIIIHNNPDVLILQNPEKLSEAQILNALSTHYLLQSNSYRTLKYLLFKNKHHTALLIDDLNISQSYLNKLVKQINDFLQPTTVKIIQRNKHIFLEGPETHIIYLEYLLRHYIEKIDTLPCTCTHDFPSLAEVAYDHDLSNLNNIQRARMSTLHHTFKKRHHLLKNITLEDQEVRDVLTQIVDYHDLLDSKRLSDYLTEDSRLFVNLLARITSSQLEDQPTKVAIGKRLMALQTPLLKDVSYFIEELRLKFIPSMTTSSPEYAELIYIAIVHLLYIRIFNYDFKKLLKTKNTPQSVEHQISQPIYHEICQYFKDSSLFNQLTPINQLAITNNCDIFIDACYTAVRSYRQATVTISFDFMNQLSFEYFLERRLRTVFNSTMLIFTDDSEEADILVTDHILPVNHQTTLFLFTNPNLSTVLNELLNLITATFHHKIMAIEYENNPN